MILIAGTRLFSHNAIGHLRVTFFSDLERVSVRNHSYENVYRLQVFLYANQTHFLMKCFTWGVVLKQRHKVPRKWPITEIVTDCEDHFIHFMFYNTKVPPLSTVQVQFSENCKLLPTVNVGITRKSWKEILCLENQIFLFQIYWGITWKPFSNLCLNNFLLSSTYSHENSKDKYLKKKIEEPKKILWLRTEMGNNNQGSRVEALNWKISKSRNVRLFSGKTKLNNWILHSAVLN